MRSHFCCNSTHPAFTIVSAYYLKSKLFKPHARIITTPNWQRRKQAGEVSGLGALITDVIMRSHFSIQEFIEVRGKKYDGESGL